MGTHAAEIIDESETILEADSVTKNGTANIGTEIGDISVVTPNIEATPLPPLKPKKTGKI